MPVLARTLALLVGGLATVGFSLSAGATHLPVENPRRTYSQGMPDGREFGYSDGFRDGEMSLYRASWNLKVTGRKYMIMYPEMPQVVPGPRYIQGYRAGYAQGYEVGYGAGRRAARAR